MCGFLGEFSFNQSNLTIKKEFETLLALSKQRGPDSTIIHSYSNYKLGFNRLAILDLSENGNQPIYSPTNRYHIVFNGEIYNYKELEKKHQIFKLKSTSDTEVLTHLLDKLGVENTIKELNGMFAIAIIDTKELHLARDFAGIKPLFYGESEKGIVFASQFNQIFKHPYFKSKLELRKEVVKEYFGLGYMQAPNTIYQDIFQVKPGELITISNLGSIKKEIICEFGAVLKKKSAQFEEKSIYEYDNLLGKIIDKQMVSDVPLASFLSGGIDSPLVCAIAKKQKPSIETFTIGVQDKKYDESKKASEYANHIKVKNHIEFINTEELISCVNHHFNYLGEPFGDYSSIPTYAITKRAKTKHTVMLSGDGGDELFFGYPRMLDIIKKQYWFKIPHFFRKPIIRLAIKFKLFDSWAPYNYKNLEDWVLGKQLHINNEKLNKIFPDTSFSNELKTLYRIPKKSNRKALLHWLRYNEFYAHMQRVLIKVDRMSMANSLEVRVPFLDKESINFAWEKTPKIIDNKFEVKELLKKMMQLYYPIELIEKQKKGFSVPMEDWLHTHLKLDLEKVVFETPFYGKELIEIRELKKYVTDYFDKKHNDAWGIWHIYAWQKWAIAEGLL